VHGIPTDKQRLKILSLVLASILKILFGIKINFYSSYHPKTSRQTKRVNQILEDMLRACVLKF